MESVLEQFNEFFQRERLDAVQLKLFETNVYRQQRNLLDLKTNYQTALDQFKLTLGLPPDLEVVIDDTYLDRFELISDQINERLISIAQLREKTGIALNVVDSVFDPVFQAQLENADFRWDDFEWPEDLSARIRKLLPFLQRAKSTLKSIVTEDRQQIERDFEKLESVREDRLAYLKEVTKAIQGGQIISSVDEELFSENSVQEADDLRLLLTNPAQDEDEDETTRSILKRAELLGDKIEEVMDKIDGFSSVESTFGAGSRAK